MADTKDHEDYQNYLEKLYDDDQTGTGELTQTESHNFEEEAGDSVGRDIDNTGTIIMDAAGNYYYQSSENLVKVEPLTKISDIAVKKVAAAIVLPPDMTKNKAQKATVSPNKTKLEANTSEKLNCKEIVSKSADNTIAPESPSQEEVYEFDENEQDPDNPGDITDPDYKSKGVIKKEKKTKADENNAALFTCTTCPYQTNKKYLLTRHLKSHCNLRPFKCSVCERDFKSNTALVNHRNTHLGYKPYGCSSCDMAFTTSGELIRHQRYRHTHIKPHKCTECDYSSVEMSKLRRHMRCHTGERPYQCPHCTYASPDTFKLKRHLRTHTGEKPYECDICHARFTQSNSLKYHRLIHSVSEKPVFQCQLCPTTCGRKTDLRQHIKKLHNTDQPLPCKRCGKELPDRYSYKMHIKTHEGEKCYRCEYCPYASISKRHLESHVFIHLNAKPFTCEICQSNFRQKSLLSRHMKIYHSRDYTPPEPRKKDHKCPHCNKMFAFNGNLMRHMEIHDPTSRLFEEREKLKVGRMKRVRPDGTVVTVSSPYGQLPKILDDNEETEENQQVDEEEYQEQYEEGEEYNEDNIQYVYDDYEAEEYDEYEEQDVEEQNEDQLDDTNERKPSIDVKQEKMETTDVAVKKTLTVKNEENSDTEIMSLEVHDDQGYVVVEVMPDDDEEEEQQQEQGKIHQVKLQTVEPSTITKNVNQSTPKTLQKNIQPLISDYFGFEVNAEDDDDEETKGAIKLLEMIEQE